MLRSVNRDCRTRIICFIVYVMSVVQKSNQGCLSGDKLYDSRQPNMSFSALPYPYITKETNITLTCIGWVNNFGVHNYMHRVVFYRNGIFQSECRIPRFTYRQSLTCVANMTNINDATVFRCQVLANFAPCNTHSLRFILHNQMPVKIVSRRRSFDVNTLILEFNTDSYPEPKIKWLLNNTINETKPFLSEKRIANTTFHTNSTLLVHNNELPLKIQCLFENEVNTVRSIVVYAGFIHASFPRISNNSIEMEWEVHPNTTISNITHYKILLRNEIQSFEVMVPANVSHHIFNNLTSGDSYITTIFGALENGDEVTSRVHTVTTLRDIKIQNITTRTTFVTWESHHQNKYFNPGLRPMQIRISQRQRINVTDRIVQATGINATNLLLTWLEPNETYTIILQAVTDHYVVDLSEKKIFRTLDSLPKPQTVTVSNITATDASVSWIYNSKPRYKGEIQGFRVVLTTHGVSVVNLTTPDTSLVVEHLKPDTFYHVTVNAYDPYGPGYPNKQSNFTTMEQKPDIRKSTHLSNTPQAWVIAVAISSMAVVGIFIAWFVIQRRRNRKSAIKTDLGQIQNSNNPFDISLDILFPNRRKPDVCQLEATSPWEIPRNRLIVFKEVLGGGQFGVVQKGVVNKSSNIDKNTTDVAVKSIKNNNDENSCWDLLCELEILKHVNTENHRNIIKLVGACTKEEPLAIVMAFYKKGNLKNVLMQSRVSQNTTVNYENLYSKLSETQLLTIAMGVANGMIYLGERKVIHRDLASRNILMDDELVPKIGDFGLARKINDNNLQYVIQKHNILPVKWMALESLEKGKFTIFSDVWSYGVLLWEICTLGEEPYPTISPYDILDHIRSGKRLVKPSFCSNEIYSLMENCWNSDEADRLSFTDIHSKLEEMLSTGKVKYINVTHVYEEQLIVDGQVNQTMEDDELEII